MASAEWARKSAKVYLSVQNGILNLDFVGLITDDVIQRFANESPGKLRRLGFVSAILAHFDKAMVACTARGLSLPLFSQSVREVLQIPGAVVCKESDWAIFQEHANQVIEVGVSRAIYVVSEAAEAAAWVLAQARAARMAKISALRLGVQR